MRVVWLDSWLRRYQGIASILAQQETAPPVSDTLRRRAC